MAKSKPMLFPLILLVLIFCMSSFCCGNMQIKKLQAAGISDAAATAAKAFEELLPVAEQDSSSHELVYRDAISKYYAMIHTAINIKDTLKHEYPCKEEMFELYGELLAADRVSTKTINLIVFACTALSQGESETAIEDWLIQARNSLQHGE